MPFDLLQQDERRPQRVADDAFEPAAIEAASAASIAQCILADGLPDALRQPELAIFAFGKGPCAYVATRLVLARCVGCVLMPALDARGNTLEPSLDDQSCYIYAVSDSVLVVACQYDVPPELAHSWAACVVDNVHPQHSLIMDAQPCGMLGSAIGADAADAATVPLRALESEAHCTYRRGRSAALPAPMLEPPGMLGGVSAAMLTQLHVSGASALALVAIQPASSCSGELIGALDRSVGALANGAAPQLARALDASGCSPHDFKVRVDALLVKLGGMPSSSGELYA